MPPPVPIFVHIDGDTLKAVKGKQQHRTTGCTSFAGIAVLVGLHIWGLFILAPSGPLHCDMENVLKKLSEVSCLASNVGPKWAS